MPRIDVKVVTSKYESEMGMRIADLLFEGYQMHGELSTFDRWEDERNYRAELIRRVQVTYFKQVMIRK